MEAHRAAFEYDWRSRLHTPLSDVPERMSWGEAWRVYTVLAKDPSSAIAAAQEGWDYPLQREALILADLYDLTHQIATGGKAPKPYPRPFDMRDKTRIGKTTLPVDKVLALLARRGPATSPAPQKRPRDARGRFVSAPKE